VARVARNAGVNPSNASGTHENLANLYAFLGDFGASAHNAERAFAYALAAGDRERELNALAAQAWADHLLGEVESASHLFQAAQKVSRDLGVPVLLQLYGIRYAEHLRRIKAEATARAVTEANLRFGEIANWLPISSLAHRILGDLEADAAQHDSAIGHFDEAVRIAQNVARRDVLIDALIGRGRWSARQGRVEAAREDLSEALAYADRGSYRVYQVDIRLALALAHHAAGDISISRAEADYAHRMSSEMNYSWGKTDAEKILRTVNERFRDDHRND
jgi:tetratricopeptide (TPR) repeat protein